MFLNTINIRLRSIIYIFKKSKITTGLGNRIRTLFISPKKVTNPKNTPYLPKIRNFGKGSFFSLNMGLGKCAYWSLFHENKSILFILTLLTFQTVNYSWMQKTGLSFLFYKNDFKIQIEISSGKRRQRSYPLLTQRAERSLQRKILGRAKNFLTFYAESAGYLHPKIFILSKKRLVYTLQLSTWKNFKNISHGFMKYLNAIIWPFHTQIST